MPRYRTRLDRAAQELHLGAVQGLAGEVAAWAAADGRSGAAAELAELGRGVLRSHTLDAGSGPEALRAVAPDRARRLAELAAARNCLAAPLPVASTITR